ncbi:MAG: hypothetical protein IPG70_05070 [Moraxellaceae bacterium]|nr:hypothetical protein [Moraxellaceae bacterium]
MWVTTVYFMGEGERVEIRHIATSRMNFANGAACCGVDWYKIGRLIRYA